MDEIIFTWGLVIMAIINILLDKNWNRPKHVLGMQIFCAYDTVPISIIQIFLQKCLTIGVILNV